MGYNTDFYGRVNITPPLDKKTVDYINNFRKTRRMKRDVDILINEYSGKHGFKGEYGKDGEYFIGDPPFKDKTSSVIDYNKPPSTQPGLWCGWEIEEDGNSIFWDGGEKFYNSKTWMEYIIDNFLAPYEYICNGTISAQGEEQGDNWDLIVEDNHVSKSETVTYSKVEIINAAKEVLEDYPKLEERLITRLLGEGV